MNFLEKTALKFLIWRMKVGWGDGCPDFEETCAQCRAKRARTFLEDDYLDLLMGDN